VNAAQNIRVGTSGFTAAGWEGSFYPARMKPDGFLTFYAEHFNTVEVDSTFYRTPSPHTVSGWASRTPADFIFSVKIPQVITHEKVLAGCDAEFKQFIETMHILGEKLGPMVFQFPFFDRSVFKTRGEFFTRLTPFLKKLPHDYKFAVEIRNREWLDARLADLLREHRVALVLQDRSRMPRPTELAERFDPITMDWTYIRWLGDRKGIEQITKTWNRTVVDRTDQLASWVDFCDRTTRRGVTVYAYANNHYAGSGPSTVELFRDLWHARGLPEIGRPQRKPPTGAPRPRLLRQFLNENLLLSSLGGFAWILAHWGTRLLVALSPENLPDSQEIYPDMHLLPYTLSFC
jgi:uncharacterized protein YecE (DUF72 family)